MTKINVDSAYVGLPAVQPIPTNILQSGLMSSTSVAAECFIQQRLSQKLQAFLVTYVSTVFSNYPIDGV